jgi:hypothetical protein
MPRPDKGLSRKEIRQREQRYRKKARDNGMTRRQIKAKDRARGGRKGGCAVVGVALAGVAAARMSGQI